jgi:hypothetical protein
MITIEINMGAAAVNTTQKTIKRSEPQNSPAQSRATTAVTIIHRRVDIRGNVMAWSRTRSVLVQASHRELEIVVTRSANFVPLPITPHLRAGRTAGTP